MAFVFRSPCLGLNIDLRLCINVFMLDLSTVVGLRRKCSRVDPLCCRDVTDDSICCLDESFPKTGPFTSDPFPPCRRLAASPSSTDGRSIATARENSWISLLTSDGIVLSRSVSVFSAPLATISSRQPRNSTAGYSSSSERNVIRHAADRARGAVCERRKHQT